MHSYVNNGSISALFYQSFYERFQQESYRQSRWRRLSLKFRKSHNMTDYHFMCIHRIYPKYLDKQARSNNVDPDQTPQNAASDQGLHVCHSSCNFRQITGSTSVKWTLTLKTPRKPASENVVCLYRLLNILANFSNPFLHTGKQCWPRSDCS